MVGLWFLLRCIYDYIYLGSKEDEPIVDSRRDQAWLNWDASLKFSLGCYLSLISIWDILIMSIWVMVM